MPLPAQHAGHGRGHGRPAHPLLQLHVGRAPQLHRHAVAGDERCSGRAAERELLSSHGFSKNQLCVWKYPSLVKVAELEGHSSRVLHTAVSPCGGVVVSAAADETLRFWKVWEGGDRKKKEGTAAAGLIGLGNAGGRDGWQAERAHSQHAMRKKRRREGGRRRGGGGQCARSVSKVASRQRCAVCSALVLDIVPW